MKRVITVMLTLLFLSSIALIPSVFMADTMDEQADISLESLAVLSQTTTTGVRVAIYNEANTTAPVFSAAEALTNYVTEIRTLLQGAGHDVTLLTTSDILNHELITADFDVFVLVNNLPRESITKLVREFWMGGGGLLTFNGAMSYLWYESIIWPGVSADPRGLAWDYVQCDVQRVSVRHPTMLEYDVNDTVSERAAEWATTVDTFMTASPVGYYITPLLLNTTSPMYISGLAMDLNHKEGGRLVHLPGDGNNIPEDFESIIVDSVEWLKPRVKGRIAFDMSHMPRLGIDPWDVELVTIYVAGNNFYEFRNLAVNHSYTFDKLYPSASGNLTAERLAKYDVLVMAWPDLEPRNSEYAAVEAWVEAGGSLLVLGDRTGLGGDGYIWINTLLQDFDMSLGTTDVLDYSTCVPATHVMLEGCSALNVGFRNYLSVLGDAEELWLDLGNPVVACQEYGRGRAVLSGDMNIFDSLQLPMSSNQWFALNVLNWLTAADAEILLFSHLGNGYYEDCTVALNDLNLPYMLVWHALYLVPNMDAKNYSLVIVDEPNSPMSTANLDALYSHVDNGGKLLMSYYDMDSAPTHPLWSLLGVEYSATVHLDPSMYVWRHSHPVFNRPHDHSDMEYKAAPVTADDGDEVTVLPGATALAGATATEQDDKAFMTLNNGGRTIFASYLIYQCRGDEDNSAYRDSVELWQNLVTYMAIPSGGFILDTTTLLIIGVGAIGVVAVVGIAARRRGGAAAPPPKKKKTKK